MVLIHKPWLQISSQTEEARRCLRATFPARQLYQVTATINEGNDPMMLRLSQGDLVGVILQKDPMGNESRWYVDSGGKNYTLLALLHLDLCALSQSLGANISVGECI